MRIASGSENGKVALAFACVVEAIELGHERSTTFLAQNGVAAHVPAITRENAVEFPG